MSGMRSGRWGYPSRAEAERMAAAFAETGSPMSLNAFSYLAAAADSGWVNFVTSPLTPDGVPTCGEV